MGECGTMVRATFAFLLLLIVGCDDHSSANSRTLDVEDPDFRQGQLYQKQGENRKALECFLKVIDARKGAAESHLEAGRMYSDLLDPLPAIYHFNQYIRLKPNSQQAEIVGQMIKTAEKQYLQQIPGRPLSADTGGSLDANQTIRRLQNENDKLKREVADLSRGQRPAENKTTPTISASGKPEKTISSNPVATSPENKGNIPKTYVVQKNDNLSIISRKIYGTSNRATDIFKANKDKMASPATLQVGMTLVIPE